MTTSSSTGSDSETRFQAIIDNVIDGIITIDSAATIVTFNLAAQRIFGYGQDEVLGQNLKMLMPEPITNASLII